MTVTTAPTVKAQELVSFGLVESASVNSIADFTPSKFNESKVTSQKGDFVNNFICHLIFYCIYCVSLVLYILIDLSLGSFLKNKLDELIIFGKKTVFEKTPAFA